MQDERQVVRQNRFNGKAINTVIIVPITIYNASFAFMVGEITVFTCQKKCLANFPNIFSKIK